MNVLILIAGILLLLVVSIDILTTILQTEGGGIISTKVSNIIWQVLFFLAGKNKTQTGIEINETHVKK